MCHRDNDPIKEQIPFENLLNFYYAETVRPSDVVVKVVYFITHELHS